jgi:hypothetical protein
MHRARCARRGAAGKREIFADRFADDLGAGIEQPRDQFRDEAFQHRSSVGQGNTSQGVCVLDGNLLAGKLAAARALDVRLGNPGAVLVLFALRPIICPARIFDFGNIVGQRREQAVALAERLDEADHRVGVAVGDVDAQAVAEFAQLFGRWEFERHRLLSRGRARGRERDRSAFAADLNRHAACVLALMLQRIACAQFFTLGWQCRTLASVRQSPLYASVARLLLK